VLVAAAIAAAELHRLGAHSECQQTNQQQQDRHWEHRPVSLAAEWKVKEFEGGKQQKARDVAVVNGDRAAVVLMLGAAAQQQSKLTHLMRPAVSGTTGSTFNCTEGACPGHSTSLPAAGSAVAAVCLAPGTAVPSSTSGGSCWSKTTSTTHERHEYHKE
jgi:hypothetical protein